MRQTIVPWPPIPENIRREMGFTPNLPGGENSVAAALIPGHPEIEAIVAPDAEDLRARWCRLHAEREMDAFLRGDAYEYPLLTPAHLFNPRVPPNPPRDGLPVSHGGTGAYDPMPAVSLGRMTYLNFAEMKRAGV